MCNVAMEVIEMAKAAALSVFGGGTYFRERFSGREVNSKKAVSCLRFVQMHH